MSIVPWRNKSELGGADTGMARFRNEIDTLFDRFLGNWGANPLESLPARFGFGPRMDLAETDHEVVVKAELPGVDPKDVDIRVEGNYLTIRGEKKQEKEEKRSDYHYVERQYGTFSRSIQLPSTIDPDKVDAGFKEGVLTITVAKRPEAKAKKIPVRNA